MASEIGVDISFVDAVVGAELTADEIERVYDSKENHKRFKRPLSRQEIGCYLSHKYIWKKIASSDLSGAVVLEDDAVIDGDLAGLIDDLSRIDIESHYIKLDGAGNQPSDAAPLRLGRYKLRTVRRVAPRTTGYVLGRDAARQLCEYQLRFFRPVDMDLKHYWEHKVPILTISPQLVTEYEPYLTKSTIEESRNALKPNSSILRFWKNLLYQARYSWACYTHTPKTIESSSSKKEYSDYA